jgi:hypothetical protein
MPLIKYTHVNFARKTLELIGAVNTIIKEYSRQGYDMTLRQVYYQLVSRDIIPNKQTEYKRLGGIISDARRAGLIDWHAIVDRTRNLRGNSHWDDPAQIVAACAHSFKLDLWENQPVRIEIWIEKDALAGVFDRVASEEDVAYFSCRGYTSDSEMWSAAQRLAAYQKGGQQPIVLHFGDHDPSGIDMTRDIEDRLRLFGAHTAEVRRLALTMDQIDQYNPPPNPAKDSDARFQGYQERYGNESWELDALNPTVLGDLVREETAKLRVRPLWDARIAEREKGRAELSLLSDRYSEAVDFLNNPDDWTNQ